MNTPFLRLGSAWYPEHWDDAVVHHDLVLMRELGFNTVRVGEFAWARFEPEPGHYDTGWMLRAIDLAHAAGIGVIMCTPTAGPPAWLLHAQPDLGFVDSTGYRHGIGGRQAADYCHPDFQAHSRRITTVIAKAFGRHPALVGWQTDNELRGHQKLSLSPSALSGWHRWLEQRYNTVDQLNATWGTQVWSNHYHSFAQVPGPHPLPNYCHHHSLLIDYRRYMNAVAVEFQRQQVDIIRAHSSAPITHNSEDSVDEWDLTRDLDVAGHDCYGRFMPLAAVVMRMDCMRALKPGRRFWVTETDAEGDFADGLFPNGWTANYAMLAYCAGAELVSYWPWRNNRSGCEIGGHDGLVLACGRPSMGWEPAQRTSALRTQLDPLLQTFSPAPAPTAFIRAERNGHYFYIDRTGGLEPNFDFRGRLGAHHQTLHDLGLWRDVVYDQAEITGYRMVVSPYLPFTSPTFLTRLLAHLAGGGVWVVGPYTGYLSEHHTNHSDRLFGPLEAALGLEVQVFRSIRALPVRFADGSTTTATMHATVFAPATGDEVLATYGGDRLEGLAWGLRRQIGAGVVYVLGSEIDDAARLRLYQAICQREGITTYPLPDRVLRIPQIDAHGRSAWALVNASRHAQNIALPAPGSDALNGQRTGHSLTMPSNSNAFVIFDGPVNP